MSDTEEIFDTGEPEIIEQKKKGRKPMSEERKQQLREQLKKAREAKKARKEAGKEAPPKDPKKQGINGTKKMLEAEGDEPAVYVKAVKRVGKDHTADIKALKEEIASLKSNSKASKEDLEEIKSLKAELKELRDLAKQYKQQQSKKKVEKDSVKKNVTLEVQAQAKAVAVKEQKKVEEVAPLIPPTPVKPRYATYQKSIWSQFS